MPIRRLPEYLINRLKAGEIVERPASVIKELVENSLDAGATEIKITINDGGKSLISVEDNGSGIELTDMDLLLERYATSKIYSEQDLEYIKSYGFRGEALASISEVSKTTIISKTAYSEIGTKLTKLGESLNINHLPVGFDKGTSILIQDIFYNVPARLKFLKSSQTEFFYCYNYFVDLAIYHWDKTLILAKNDKNIYDLAPSTDILDRITQLYKKDRSKNLKDISYQDENIKLLGLVSDSSLTFGSGDNIKIYVDGRPVQDKIIKRALMDAYHRQISPGEYPFAVIMVYTKPGVVDVNVHPRKSEVKFVDTQKIYQIVHESINKVLGENKIAHINSSFSGNFSNNYSNNVSYNNISSNPLFGTEVNITSNTGFSSNEDSYGGSNDQIGEYKVIGQIRDSYIILQGDDGIYYIDQHALAERIAFEKMKRDLNLNNNGDLTSDILLQPMLVEIPQIPYIKDKIELLNELGFDCSVFSENRIIVYAVPQIFVKHKVDLETLFNHVFYLEKLNFDHILDKIFASKACKTSIKAGDKLSIIQMTQLVKEGFEEIPGMFVCQHGRPFFVKSDKSELDKFFDR